MALNVDAILENVRTLLPHCRVDMIPALLENTLRLRVRHHGREAVRVVGLGHLDAVPFPELHLRNAALDLAAQVAPRIEPRQYGAIAAIDEDFLAETPANLQAELTQRLATAMATELDRQILEDILATANTQVPDEPFTMETLETARRNRDRGTAKQVTKDGWVLEEGWVTA